MSTTILARTSVFRQLKAPPLGRSLHKSRPARSDHGHYNHLPFTFPVEKKKLFAVKVFCFLGAGFAIPFAATKWQLSKSQAT